MNNKKCLITTLKDTVNDPDMIFEGLNDIVFEAVVTNTQFIIGNSNQQAYVEPLPGNTWSDGTTEKRYVDVNGVTSKTLNPKQQYRLHLPKNSRLIKISQAIIKTNLSMYNIINSSTLQSIWMIDYDLFPITVRELCKNKKFSDFVIQGTNLITGTIKDIIPYLGDMYANLGRFSVQETPITGTLEDFSEAFSKTTYGSKVFVFHKSLITGTIESFVQKIRSYGIYKTSPTDFYIKIVLTAGTQDITWKGEQISTYEANDSSKISWTETTITFNNETIEA